MTEPVTTNKSLIIPNTGDLSGAWGTSALNPNFQTIDALTGGVTTITLSSATTILLTVPATTGIWPNALSQSVNSLIKFTGAQTGVATIQFTLPGFYIVHNQCTNSNGTSYIVLSPSVGTGNHIGVPPGQKIHVFYDGTDMDYVNFPTPGSALDLHVNTTSFGLGNNTPLWMAACSVQPYLIKDGTVYSSSVYPALSFLLGSTYGGNGITTFGVPDERNRFRLAVDPGGATGRVTVAGSGINGAALGTTGGGQNQTLTLAQLPTGITVTGTITASVVGSQTFPAIAGGNSVSNVQAGGGGSLNVPASSGTWGGQNQVSGNNTMTSSNTSGSSHPIMPPTSVSMLALIKT